VSFDALAGDPAVLLHQVVHREMDPRSPRPGTSMSRGPVGADREHDRVESLTQLRCADVGPMS